MDKQNTEFVQSVASRIQPNIQVTIDYPTKNAGGKMPILDLSVWMATDFDQVTHEVTVNVLHEYYYKEVAS